MMKLLSCLWLLPCLAALGSTEDQLNKRFAAPPGGTVVVDVDFGSIRVNGHPADEVVVDVWRNVSRRSASSEEAFLKQHPVEVIQDGSTVTVRCRGGANGGSSGSWSLFGFLFGGSGNRNEAKYVITVPARFIARLKTSGGSIEAGDLEGQVKANTSGGSLHFTRLKGPLDGETSGGSVHVQECQGALAVHTSGGRIEVTGGSGSFVGFTSGGSIAVQQFRGPAQVETSGGSITLEGVSGRIKGATSGGSISATLPGPLAEPIDLSTGGGSVTVRLPDSAAFNLDAETSGGGVQSELPVVSPGKHEHSRLVGAVNGGGQAVLLRTSGGNIRVDRL